MSILRSPFSLPRLSLFDLDGTLVHHDSDFFYPHFVKIYSELGQQAPDRDRFEELIRRQHLFLEIPEQDRHAFETEFWVRFDKIAPPEAVLIEGGIEALDHFATNGSKIAIITARTHLPDDVERCLIKTGLLKYINVISTLGEPNLVKRVTEPGLKKEQIEYVCQKMGHPPSESLVAGDSPSDITSGKLAGVRYTIGILGNIDRELLEAVKPDLIVHNVAEIVDFFKI